MEEDTVRKVEERKQQARDRDIYGKVSLIVCYLGSSAASYEEMEGRFENDNFSLYYSRSRNTEGVILRNRAEVIYKGERVFLELNHDIFMYLPGEWEAELDVLSEEPKQISEKNRLERIAREQKSLSEIHLKDLRERFGL